MLGTLSINQKDLSDFGIKVTDSGIFTSSEADIESVSAAGRSGDLHISNHRFKNIAITYPSIIYEGFEENFTAFRSWIMAQGELRIEDSFRPEYFRTGRVSGAITPNYKHRGAGTFEITLDCAPQLWLKSGEEGIECTDGQIINNPTYQGSEPIIRAYGMGTLTVGTTVIKVNKAGLNYIDIDCHTHQAYEGDVFRNENITVNKWGKLAIGDNTVTLSGIKKVEVIPRWFEII